MSAPSRPDPSRSRRGGREKVVERLVAWIWERQALVGPLTGDDGHEYQVVFRGRPWGERGADFQGAIVARRDGLLLRGDVEIHVRSSDWRKHGHGRDPAYNQTVCHVVLWRDDERPTGRQDGTTIPTLELVTRLAAPLAELERRHDAERPAGGAAVDRGHGAPASAERPCVPDLTQLGVLLDRAGLARFHEHAAALEGDLACLPPAEVLYRGISRAMGYTANTRGFERLAETVSLATLADVIGSEGLEPSAGRRDDAAAALARAQAALLGAAGLLPSQRGIEVVDGWPSTLEQAWTGVRFAVGGSLPPTAWRSWRVRPENLPARRAAGLSYLVANRLVADRPADGGQNRGRVGGPQRNGRGGGEPQRSGSRDGALMDDLLADLDDAERLGRPARLAERWRVHVTDRFWPGHFDFGRPAPGEHVWLVGASRADEVTVNVVLPFLYAIGQASGKAALTERVLALYRRYPSTAPNRVTREMARQLGGPRGAEVARGACRQQGLIHLYRHWCDMHDCGGCAAQQAVST